MRGDGERHEVPQGGAAIVYPPYHYFDVEGQRQEVLPEVENDTRPGGFGATVAYQPEAAADAYRQVEAFLVRYLTSAPR